MCFFVLKNVLGQDFFWFLASTGFPLPPHEIDAYSPSVWFCRYLFLCDADGVAPKESDYFFRCYERGKFTKKRLGYKKYGQLFKEIAVYNGHKEKEFSGM